MARVINLWMSEGWGDGWLVLKLGFLLHLFFLQEGGKGDVVYSTRQTGLRFVLYSYEFPIEIQQPSCEASCSLLVTLTGSLISQNIYLW